MIAGHFSLLLKMESLSCSFCVHCSEWKCSSGTLWTSSVDPCCGNSGTPAMQYSSCPKSWTTEDPGSFWKISWNCCFPLAVIGIHSGSMTSYLMYIIVAWKVRHDNIIEARVSNLKLTYNRPWTSQLESYNFGNEHQKLMDWVFLLGQLQLH